MARALGWTAEQLTDVVAGRANISDGMAHRLAGLFGMSAQFWINLQTRWDAYRMEATPAQDTGDR